MNPCSIRNRSLQFICDLSLNYWTNTIESKPSEETMKLSRNALWLALTHTLIVLITLIMGVSASFLPSLHEGLCIYLCVSFSCRDFYADHFSSLEYITYHDWWLRNRKIIENALFRAKMHPISVWRRSISQTSFELSCHSLNRRDDQKRIESDLIYPLLY
jgi:hypothetical protein